MTKLLNMLFKRYFKRITLEPGALRELIDGTIDAILKKKRDDAYAGLLHSSRSTIRSSRFMQILPSGTVSMRVTCFGEVSLPQPLFDKLDQDRHLPQQRKRLFPGQTFLIKQRQNIPNELFFDLGNTRGFG